jgi:hypothetical protein
MKTGPALLLTGILVSGCAAPNESIPLTSSHPANSQAEEAPFIHSNHRPAPDSLSNRSKARLEDDANAATSRQRGSEGHYVCPMHPEVRSNKPAQCPKCGMTLVQK